MQSMQDLHGSVKPDVFPTRAPWMAYSFGQRGRPGGAPSPLRNAFHASRNMKVSAAKKTGKTTSGGQTSKYIGSDDSDREFAKYVICSVKTPDEVDTQTFPVVEKRIGYIFKEKRLLKAALSFGTPERLVARKLAWRADTFMSNHVTNVLLQTRPQQSLKGLHTARESVCRRTACAAKMKQMGIVAVLKQRAQGRQVGKNTVAETFESLLEAIRLDGGPAAAAAFVNRFVKIS